MIMYLHNAKRYKDNPIIEEYKSIEDPKIDYHTYCQIRKRGWSIDKSAFTPKVTTKKKDDND